VCGNGVLEAPEECDDGNTTDGDTCSATCTIEGGGPCVPSPSQFPGQAVSPLHCSLVKVTPPYLVDFMGAPGTVADRSGLGTGLTMILPKPTGASYLPAKVVVDAVAQELRLTTTSGIQHGTANNLDDGLGVGLNLPNEDLRIQTALLDPPAGSGAFEQAGLWFGISQHDYVKLVLVSTPSGAVVQGLMEQADVPGAVFQRAITLPATRVAFTIEARPVARTLTLFYAVGASGPQLLTTFSNVPASWFSTDAAGIDFNVGTRSFAGISATHRNRAASLGPLAYRFDSFEVAEISGPPPPPDPPPGGAIDFSRWSVNLSNPTAIAYGPDGRVYVATASGTIRSLLLDHDSRTVLSDTTITSVQNRLVLGLTVDPASTPGDVVLWVAHSNVSQGSGQANSGRISRLSGPGFGTRLDVIVGLPRAIANHSLNHIHFGPDGRLYIASGGNTGGGAANDSGSEFGPRPEQPLSAAILVADVTSPTFDGDCTPTQSPSVMDATGIATKEVNCDVQVYASGLRNSYDFVFHSNGHVYATDNGLGVEGTFPDLAPDALSWDPASGCEGPIQGMTARNAHNPGARPDLLQRIEPGAYYGHPNPSRDECVFFAGNPTAGADAPVPNESGGADALDTSRYPVGREAAPGFRPAIFSFGGGKSANAVIEFTSPAFCGGLRGDLLVTYFSNADQVRHLTLASDGNSVFSSGTLPRSTLGTGGAATLVDPLPIAQDPLGRLYVGEFGGGRLAVFEPVAAGCWQTDGVPALPAPLLDAGGAVLNGELYVIAGKDASGPQRTVHVYNPFTNQWRLAPPLPAAYPAVENPAVAVLGGALYVIGGSTEPFAGSVASAARFDPVTQAWTMLAPLPAPRGGATAQGIASRIYVAGGMDAGSSRQELFIYDPATNTWSAGAPMSVPRDNPMSAAVGGRLYVFGGRTRLAPPFPDNGTLSSAEVYDPAANAWQPIAPMPTGRRTGNAVVVNGRVLLFGGEGAGTFAQNELYDPATDGWRILEPMPLPRHGAVAGRIGNGIFVVGGGPTEGTSFTTDVDVFRFE
jgi:cysteine-rich repeat protein